MKKVLSWFFGLIMLVGFVGLIGTVGASDMGEIGLVRFIVQGGIALVVIFFGYMGLEVIDYNFSE